MNENQTNVGNTSEEVKTYTKEEYEALATQMEKQKNAFDKASSELAALKKQMKEEQQSKMTEDEKASTRIKELEEALQAAQCENNKSKMSNVLISGGFAEEEANTLANAFITNDMESFMKTLVDSRKTLVENHSKELQNYKLQGMAKPEMSGGALSQMEQLNKQFNDAQESNDMLEMVKTINTAFETKK